jgi:hypothetical protein
MLEYNDHLRANGHVVAKEPLQPLDTAVTLYWKNGKVATTDGSYAETKEQLGSLCRCRKLAGFQLKSRRSYISKHQADAEQGQVD